MKTTDQGVKYIEMIEGTVLRAYKCPADVWTIGTGHTSAAGLPKVTAGMTITKAEAREILMRDLAKFEKRVNNAVNSPESQVHDAANSFDFNTGAINKASWVGFHNAGEMGEAERRFKMYNKAGGRVVPGLVRRRDEESDIMFRGKYPTIVHGAVADKKRMTSVEVAESQKILKSKDLYAGEVDGKLGPITKKAILEYQEMHPDLANDGKLGPATYAQLNRDAALISKTIKEGGPLITFLGAAWVWLGDNWVPILAVGGFLVVVVVLYRRRDLFMRRINKLFNRKVA